MQLSAHQWVGKNTLNQEDENNITGADSWGFLLDYISYNTILSSLFVYVWFLK